MATIDRNIIFMSSWEKKWKKDMQGLKNAAVMH